MTDNNALAMELDWLAIAREHEQIALKGPWSGVSTPHYALSGLFKALGDEIAALRQPAPAAGEVVVYKHSHPNYPDEYDKTWLTDADKADGWTETPLYTADMLERLAATKPVDQDQVERVARAICEADKGAWYKEPSFTNDLFRKLARAAIAAMQTTTSAEQGEG